MKRFTMRGGVAALALLALTTPLALAQGMGTGSIKGKGTVGFDAKYRPLLVDGTSNTLGAFRCEGEIRVAYDAVKKANVGTGVAVFKVGGEQVVCQVTWLPDGKGNGPMRFDWRSRVTFSDGSTASSTGRYARQLPNPVVGTTQGVGLVVISIIAILIG